MKKTFTILALILAAFGFSACDEVSKVVDNATQKGKQIAQSASNVAKSSGGIIMDGSSNSVCKNYYDRLENIAFSSNLLYGDKLVKKLFRYYGTEFKKDGNETICLYFVAVGQGYTNVNLTQKEIEDLEKRLLELGESYDSLKANKEKNLKALKALKYLGILKNVYNGTLENPRISVSFLRDEIDELENEGFIMAKLFIYDKPDNGYLDFFSFSTEKLKSIYSDNSFSAYLSDLRKKATSPNDKVALQWAKQKLKEAR